MWKVIFLHNKAFWRLSLASGISHKFESRDNCLVKLYFLSCSTPAVVTLQFPACFTRVAFWWVANRESVARLLWMHTTWVFFTLSHTQPLHNSHLNTRYLIAKIQANLTWNIANTRLNKFNLTNIIILTSVFSLNDLNKVLKK